MLALSTSTLHSIYTLCLFSHLVKPSSSGTAGACGFLGKLFVCSVGKTSSWLTGGWGMKGSIGFSSLGGDGGGGGPAMKCTLVTYNRCPQYYL